MFSAAPKNWFEELIKTFRIASDEQRATCSSHLRASDEILRISIDRVLAAKDSEVEAVINAKNEEIKFLIQHVAHLEERVEIERARADKAVDQLLNVKTGIAPIRNADLERDLAERSARAVVNEDPKKREEMRRIFSEVNAVGEDEGVEPANERLEAVGGHAA